MRWQTIHLISLRRLRLAIDISLMIAITGLVTVFWHMSIGPALERFLFFNGANYTALQWDADHSDVKESGAPAVSLLPATYLSTEPIDVLSDEPLRLASMEVTGTWAALNDDVQFLGSTLTAGEYSRDGVLVDTATLSLLGLNIGDQINLLSLENGEGATACTTRITGTTHTYVDYLTGNEGLTILGRNTCPELHQIDVNSSLTFHSTDVDTSNATTVTRWESTGQRLVKDISLMGVGLIFLAVAGGLWSLVASRIFSTERRAMARTSMTLIRLGVSPRKLQAFSNAVFLGYLIAGITGGMLIAQLGSSIFLGVFIQPITAVVYASIFFALGVTVLALPSLRADVTTRLMRDMNH